MSTQHQTSDRVASETVGSGIGIYARRIICFAVPSVGFAFFQLVRYVNDISRHDVIGPFDDRIARSYGFKSIAIDARFGNQLAVEVFFVSFANCFANARYRSFFCRKMKRIDDLYQPSCNFPCVIACAITYNAMPLNRITHANGCRGVDVDDQIQSHVLSKQ